MITYSLERSGQYKPQLLNLKLKKSSHAKMESVITHESTYSAAVSWLGSQNKIFVGNNTSLQTNLNFKAINLSDI